VDDAGTLAIETAPGHAQRVVWPDGVTVAETGSGLALIGFFGQTIAREGDFIQMGGGKSAQFLRCNPRHHSLGAMDLFPDAALNHFMVEMKTLDDVGMAFDLVGEKKITDQKRISDREREYSVEIKLRNRKKVPVTIVSEESVGGDFDVTKNSHPFTKKDASTIQFAVAVPAGKEVVVTYTVRARY